MATLTTHGINISVMTTYHPEHSTASRHQFVFSYHIKITNKSKYAVQLLRRYWKIVDAAGRIKEVEGDGVIGQQPILQPNETHEYTSWCPMVTELGNMSGYYTMLRLSDAHSFDAEIPKFLLCTPFKDN